jgi:hypothetical protein
MVVALNQPPNQPTSGSESPWAISGVENHYNLSIESVVVAPSQVLVEMIVVGEYIDIVWR